MITQNCIIFKYVVYNATVKKLPLMFERSEFNYESRWSLNSTFYSNILKSCEDSLYYLTLSNVFITVNQRNK